MINFKKLVAPYENDLLKTLAHFVSIPSVYDEAGASETMPYGKNIDTSLKEFAKLGEMYGFKVERNNRYTELSLGEKGKIIGIYGHLDVVPASANAKRNMYELTREKDILYGRGVADDKGPLLAAFYAVKALKDNNLIHNHQIRIFAGGDEEKHNTCISAYSKTHPSPDYGFSPDSDFPLIFAEKGMLHLLLSKKINFKHIVSITGGLVANAVNDRTTFTVDNIEEVKDHLTTPHQIEGNKITFIGVAAHGSLPHLGKNAFLLGLKELATLNHDDEALKLAEDFLDTTCKRIGAYHHGKYLQDTTVCVGIVDYHDGELKMTANVRCPEEPSVMVILQEILKTTGFTLLHEEHNEHLYRDPASPLVKTLMKAYQDETGDTKTPPTITGGQTYAHHLDNTVAFGVEPAGVNYAMHQDNEHIPLKDLMRATAIYARAIYYFLNLNDEN
ncbi:MAG: Sapep family Mn(2+)-dependent dipeptidase [Bacilli bacterium]|nr:Sapep family Mn(2+)-dependent dipeptidase [Bacilli bacterium]